jgi:hypothetical protein
MVESPLKITARTWKQSTENAKTGRQSMLRNSTRQKYSLIHLPSKYRRVDMNRPVWLDGRKVRLVPRCRILGLILDNKLNWNAKSSMDLNLFVP